MERIFEAADQTSRLLFEDGLKIWIFMDLFEGRNGSLCGDRCDCASDDFVWRQV